MTLAVKAESLIKIFEIDVNRVCGVDDAVRALYFCVGRFL